MHVDRVEDGSGLTAKQLILELNEKHRGCNVGERKARVELKVPGNIYTTRRWNSFLEAYKILLPSVHPFKAIEDVRDFIGLSLGMESFLPRNEAE